MELQAKKREILGKAVKNLRNQGFIPAVLYGENIKNLNLLIDSKNFEKVYSQAGESSILDLKIEENDNRNVLIHDLQWDRLSGKVSHIDFYEIKMDQKVRVKIPVEFRGESPAVKLGNVLIKNFHEIEIEALPMQLPKSIIVDLSILKEIGDKITVSEIILPEGVKLITEPSVALVSVEEPRAEEIVSSATSQEKIISDIKTEKEEKQKIKEKETKEES